jgi:hypothetical protein
MRWKKQIFNHASRGEADDSTRDHSDKLVRIVEPVHTLVGSSLASREALIELSAFAFRVRLLFLPGLVGFYLVLDKLTSHRPFKLHAIVLYSLLHGFASYLAELLYQSPGIYLPRPRRELVVEFPQIGCTSRGSQEADE